MCPRQLTMHESTVIDRKDSGVLKCFAGNSQVGKLRVNFVFGHRSRYPSLYTDLNCHDGSEPEPIRHGQMTSPSRGSARSARCNMPMTAMADQGHSAGLTALRDRDLDDLRSDERRVGKEGVRKGKRG